MSLLGLRRLPPDEGEHRAGAVGSGGSGVEGGLGYVLVYNPPDAPAPGHHRGWSLTAWPAGPRAWSTRLAAHGAGEHAGPRVAKAVAVRILGEHGVTVGGWADRAGAGGGLTMFSARSSAGTGREPGVG